jgi:hypothetical protein
VALFSARARAVDPAFTSSHAVQELCLRLDSLPLALELAAARTALFSPKQLLERLSQRLDLLKGERDADPRQQTLRATIEWSYDLLTQEEQQLFVRLAVFAGGCTYEAAEEVCDADPDTLQSLLDKSLVRKRDSEAGPRYWTLETIREYAARLEESSERRPRADPWRVLPGSRRGGGPHLATGPWLDRWTSGGQHRSARPRGRNAFFAQRCALRLLVLEGMSRRMDSNRVPRLIERQLPHAAGHLSRRARSALSLVKTRHRGRTSRRHSQSRAPWGIRI